MSGLGWISLWCPRGLWSECRQGNHVLFGRVWRDQRGATAIEFALGAGLLFFLLLNGVDLGRYLYLRSQAENAAQMGAHAIWQRCDPMKLPIVAKCYDTQDAAKTAVANVISSTASGVTKDNVVLAEGYYCADGANTLLLVPDVTKPPLQCLAGVVPGDYVQVRVSYPFVPIFGNLTIVSMFGNTIQTNSFMRLQ